MANDLRLRRLVAAVTPGRARATEAELRKLTPLEFQKWVVLRFGGTFAPRWSGDLGIDGYTFPYEWPIQTKQQDRVGRVRVDEFETAVGRSGKSRGFLVAFSFTQGAYREAARAKVSARVDIQLVTVSELLRNVPT